MRFPYQVTFNDGTVVDGEANTRDVVLWEMRFSANYRELDREDAPAAEFMWLVHAAERRQERTDLDLLPWLDIVDRVLRFEDAGEDRDPLTDEGEGPLIPLDQTPPTGA